MVRCVVVGEKVELELAREERERERKMPSGEMREPKLPNFLFFPLIYKIELYAR